jgi:uncharacterized membrane protein
VIKLREDFLMSAYPIGLLIASIAILIAYILVKRSSKKNKGNFLNLQKTDGRFVNAKNWVFENTNFLMISESGFISIKTALQFKDPKIFNIKDVIGFELVTNDKPVANVGGAVIGGLLFGGIGAVVGAMPKKEKIKKMSIIFKVNDFNNPTIELPMLAISAKPIAGSIYHRLLLDQAREITTTLELVEKKAKERHFKSAFFTPTNPTKIKTF